MDDFGYERYQELKEEYYRKNPTYNGEVDIDKERYIDDAMKWRATHSNDDYSDGGF